MRNTLFLTVICLLVIAFVASAASATPAFAEKEKKACGYCHVSPAGGGALNAAGEAYKKDGKLPPAPTASSTTTSSGLRLMTPPHSSFAAVR
jgi:hypothetical protein